MSIKDNQSSPAEQHVGERADVSNDSNDSNASNASNDYEAQQTNEELVEDEIHTDSEDEDEFIRKYGDINFQYIKRPRDAVWFIRPHALNYFKDGVLYRTKGERGAAKTELFLDLMYVGIIANLAGNASETASGASLLKYILFFIPMWVVWADIKDFTNYYYNEDLSQKLYILWILALLTLYVNSNEKILDGASGAALSVVPYILCRISLMIALLIYSIYVPQHRVQQRLYSVSLFITCCLWIIVIFVGKWAKVGVSIAIMVLEQIFFVVAFHPRTKKFMKLTMSTALNIEHEVERFSTFVTIAIGEFLYKIVASNPLGPGLSYKFGRGVFLLIIAYILFWLYNSGSTSKTATHPLRNNGWTAMGWIYSHIPLIASLVLSADAGGELLARESIYGEAEEGEADLYALSLFFTGGVCVSMIMIGILGLLDKSRDPPDLHIIPKFWRVIGRIPIGIIILCLSFAKMNITLMMGMTSMLLFIVLVYESIVSVPKQCLFTPRNNPPN